MFIHIVFIFPISIMAMFGIMYVDLICLFYFNRFINTPMANCKCEYFNLPFNMNTFNKLWNIIISDEAKNKI